MICAGCTASIGEQNGSRCCPACRFRTGAARPVPARDTAAASPLWLWTTDQARAAVADGDLPAIIRAYRTTTGTSQRQLAHELGYDPTYISMIETGRRQITDVAARLRIARHLGIPPRVIGVADSTDDDFTDMTHLADVTIRLAVLARQSGHSTAATNELWSLVRMLETRIAAGHIDRQVLILLVRACAEFGVCLGYVLPEERLFHAARWTGRALRWRNILTTETCWHSRCGYTAMSCGKSTGPRRLSLDCATRQT